MRRETWKEGFDGVESASRTERLKLKDVGALASPGTPSEFYRPGDRAWVLSNISTVPHDRPCAQAA